MQLILLIVLVLFVRVQSSLLDRLKSLGTSIISSSTTTLSSLSRPSSSIVSISSSLLLLSSSLLTIYTKIPSSILYNSIPDRLSIPNTTNTITIIIPGAGGPDKNTNDLLNSINNYNKQHRIKHSHVQVYNWLKWKGNLLRASSDSISVGTSIGNDISKCHNIKYVHLIGISVGSFAANTACNIIKRKKLGSTYVKLTLLDPFCSHGIFNHKYGYNNFGNNANYAEQYMNTDDPVPFTNEPLKYCYCYDITNTKERHAFIPLHGDNMHSWPVAYFARYYNKLNKRCDNHDILPRGQVIKVT
jgi:hypothetical protein